MTKQWGGRRPGSGPPRKRLNLAVVDEDAARDLAMLTKRWRSERNQPALIEEAVVMELVRQALQPTISPNGMRVNDTEQT